MSQEAAGGSEQVSFDLDFTYLVASFSPTITVSDGTVEPAGGSTSAPITASTGMLTITLYVPGYSSVSFSIDPLGSHEYPVPGLYYDYLVFELGLWLEVSGNLEGRVRTEGSGTVSTTMVSWQDTGSRSVTVTSNSDSVEGETITLILYDISYTIRIGVEARGEVLGEQMAFTILDDQELGSLTGSPSSVEGTYQIQKASIFEGILPWLLAIIVIIVVVAVVGAVAYKARKRKQAAVQPTSEEPPVPEEKPVGEAPEYEPTPPEEPEPPPPVQEPPPETPEYVPAPPPSMQEQAPQQAQQPVQTYQQPYPVVAPQTQQYGPQQGYWCPVCGQPLLFVPRFQRWFCRSCNRYV